MDCHQTTKFKVKTDQKTIIGQLLSEYRRKEAYGHENIVTIKNLDKIINTGFDASVSLNGQLKCRDRRGTPYLLIVAPI